MQKYTNTYVEKYKKFMYKNLNTDVEKYKH